MIPWLVQTAPPVFFWSLALQAVGTREPRWAGSRFSAWGRRLCYTSALNMLIPTANSSPFGEDFCFGIDVVKSALQLCIHYFCSRCNNVSFSTQDGVLERRWQTLHQGQSLTVCEHPGSVLRCLSPLTFEEVQSINSGFVLWVLPCLSLVAKKSESKPVPACVPHCLLLPRSTALLISLVSQFLFSLKYNPFWLLFVITMLIIFRADVLCSPDVAIAVATSVCSKIKCCIPYK